MKNPFRRRYAPGGYIAPRIVQNASGGVFINRPGYINNQRFELVPGRDGTGHAGYVVLLDHQLKFAWPYLTRETARSAVERGSTIRPGDAGFKRAAHTYDRYTGH